MHRRITKNGSDLTIPMSEQIYSLLLARKNNANSDIYVFPNKTSTVPIISVRRQKDKVIKETGIKFPHHCLRRTFAMLLKKKLRVDIHTVLVLLNHTSQEVIQKHYLTSQPCDFIDMYQKLSRLILLHE